MSMKLSNLNCYKEGDWFLIPLANNQYAVGLLVRGNYKNHGGLGYFWGPYQKKPNPEMLERLTPNNAKLIAWFSGLHISNGKWPMLGCKDNFSREAWPIPFFHLQNPLAPELGWLIEYDQNSDLKKMPISRTVRPMSELTHLPKDGLLGSVALEHVLKKIMGVVK